jgi:hypothetical protein
LALSETSIRGVLCQISIAGRSLFFFFDDDDDDDDDDDIYLHLAGSIRK